MAENFCTVGLYVSLCLMIFLCPFLHCKALRTAMYKRYINSIIIIIIIIIISIVCFTCHVPLTHLLCSFRFLSALQQSKAQSKLLYLLSTLVEDFKLFLANQQCIYQIQKMSRIREVKRRDEVIWHIGYVIPLINGRVIILMTFIMFRKVSKQD